MTSRKIWFISAPLYSHTDWGGFLKTALALQQKGHDVLWVSGMSLEPAIRHNGLPFCGIRETGFLFPPPPQPDVSQLSPQEAVILRYERALNTWLSEGLVADAVRAILELADEIGKPDLIAIDPFLSSAALASEKLNVPVVVCGWTAQGDLNADMLFPVQRDLSSDSQQRIQRLCDEFDLQGINFSKGPTPSIISPHLHISYFTSNWYAAEAGRLLPQNAFVGGKPDLPKAPSPKWLSNIIEDQSIGVVTLGTMFTGDLGFFSWAAHAIAREGLIPVVTIGWNPIKADKKTALIEALPKGTRLLNWIPFEHVLPRTKIMIHHGGMGTTHAVIVNGVPQIVVAHAADQRIQSRRVAQASVGLELNAHEVRQGKLWEGVQAILKAEWVQDNARKLADEMISLGGAERAAELILEIAP